MLQGFMGRRVSYLGFDRAPSPAIDRHLMGRAVRDPISLLRRKHFTFALLASSRSLILFGSQYSIDWRSWMTIRQRRE
jgi:hypothetical protein